MATKEISSFSRELLSLMPHIVRTMFKVQTDVLGKGKISVPQFLSLDLIDLKGSLKMKDIAKALNVTLPATSGLINRLVKLGLVKRTFDPRDRRLIFITLTPRGKETIEEIRTQRRKAIEKIFGKLTARERADYLSILRRLVKMLVPKRR